MGNEKQHAGIDKGGEELEKTFEEADMKPAVPHTLHVKPIINKGEEVYACWSGGTARDWFPGRVWDVKEIPGAGDYGPNRKYDVVFDDGDTESNMEEIWVTKREDYEEGLQKMEENEWLGVTNVRFPDSKDVYARLIGWYETCLDGVRVVHSSLGGALRAHDRHVIKTRGKDNIAASELNFPAEHLESVG